MGRQPKARDQAGYRQFAINLHRMIGALETDSVNDPQWVNETKAHLERAMAAFLAPKAKSGSGLKKVG